MHVNVRLFGLASVVVAVATSLGVASPPSSSAAACPDIEVVFARATTEPPGLGQAGQVFVDTLRSQTRGRTVSTYAVNYPASEDFVSSASAGAADANARVQSTVASCPNTKVVLGGYSQGALVVDLITAIPLSIGGFTPAPLAPEVADHVAAVAVFGNPLGRYVGAPLTAVSPAYGPKTADICAAGDPICSPGNAGLPTRDEEFSPAHLSYVKSGLVAQGASFAAGRL
jgi:cutinase